MSTPGRKRLAGATLLQEEPELAQFDEPFPRGGGSQIAPIEIKRAAAEATRDVYESLKAAKKPKKGAKNAKGKSKERVVVQVRPEPLALAKVRVGTLVLGQITELLYASKEYAVSLPNNLTGYCSAELNPKLLDRFLRFVVTDLGQNNEQTDARRRRLLLSISPDLVNQCLDPKGLVVGSCVQGTVASAEEKGVVLDLGAALGTGFAALSAKALADTSVGDVFLAFVVGDPNQRVKQLSVDAEVHVKTVLQEQALVPGTLVASAPVESESSFGKVYSLLGQYTATADSVHAQGVPGAVRVLFSHPAAQLGGLRPLGVSSLPHVVALKAASLPLAVGTVTSAEVVGTCPSLGVFAIILGTGKAAGTRGFVHVSQLGEGEVDLDNAPEFARGSVHAARVFSVSPTDGLCYLSFRPDVIAQQYLSINDVRIGDVVDHATIERFMSRGDVLVRLHGPVVGIAAESLLADSATRNPEQRFKLGQRVRARVLNVDLERHKVYVTLKKSIVDDPEPILTAFENDGRWHVGTVSKIVDAGSIVLFYNNVRGLLPKAEMSDASGAPADSHRVGETLRCRVVSADAASERLILSLRSNTSLHEHVGDVTKALVISKSKKEVRVQISDLGDAMLVGPKSKLNVGDEVAVRVINARLVCSDERLLTGPLPTSVNNLHVGMRLYGIVSGSHPQAGVFVQFGDKFSGLITANVLGKAKWPVLNSVVEVVVDSCDFARERVFLSLPSAAPAISVTVTAVKQTQLNVITNDGQQGRIDSSLLFDSLDEIEDTKRPLTQFSTGEEIDNVRVIGRHDAKNHRFLPLSHKTGTSVVLEIAKHDPKSVRVGSIVLGFVNNYSVDKLSLWATISPQSKVQLSLVDLSDRLEVLEDPTSYFPVGAALKLRILKMDPRLAATALDEQATVQYCLITDVEPLKLTVRLPGHRTETVECTETGEVFSKLLDTFKVGDIVPYCMNGSRVSLRIEDHEQPSFAPGTIVKGFVRNIASSGIFVSLAHKVVARVQIKEISDKYLKDWQKFANAGDVVTGKIISNEGRIEMTLKQSAITGKTTQNIDGVEIGAKYTGVVRSVAAFGVFVDFERVTGLAHKSEISDHVIEDLTKVFKPGDKVRVKVLDKSAENGRISLGMRARYFENDDEEEDAGDNLEDGDASDAADAAPSDPESEFTDDESNEDAFLLGDGSPYGHDDTSSKEPESGEKGSGLSAGFDWSGDAPAIVDDSASSSDSDSESNARRRKRRSKREEFVRDETANLQNRLPQSAKDFERLLVASPNSSVLWMNYMAFELQLGEIDGARHIAQRALKTIAQASENERLNIWIALLNLEARFGTKESLDRVFKDSQQYMDAVTMHLRMATVLAEAGRTADALEMYKRAQKKFGGENVDVWLSAMRHLFSEIGNNKTLAREMGERAIKRLPANSHKDFTKQFALLEFEFGDPERGRTLFEALLSVSPKRIDIWNVFVDQEIKQADSSKISQLFERILQQKLSMKQAKFFFKKWIAVSPDQEYVTARAREYVSSHEKPLEDIADDNE